MVSKAARATGLSANRTFFIADISANHDGSLDRAVELIHLSARAGADAAKFQNFRAEEIVSAHGFSTLGGKFSHQAKWKTSVVEVYKGASVPWDWTPILKAECDKANIEYFSTPYDLPAVDMLDPYVNMYKIGSGDITWPEMLIKVADQRKPVLIATGASEIGEVQAAIDVLRPYGVQICVMQCNTNYTGSLENFAHIHLNVLHSYRTLFPDVLLGLSDHTPGHSTVLGAVALGARVIEKHFTDDRGREGPDHPFSMSPLDWREMVDRTRELELAMGNPAKTVADNEKETVIVQRRCIRAAASLNPGTILTRDMIAVLRPAPHGSLPPSQLANVLGLKVRNAIPAGKEITWLDLESA